jgi:NADPH2:quinone reductase
MRALTVQDGQLLLVEAQLPVPKDGEILVDVAFAGINGTDVEVRDGGWQLQSRRHRKRGPAVTGIELSGIARTSGARIKAGQRVIGYSHVLSGPRTHAEVVPAAERDLQVVPDTLDLQDAASLIVGGLTAIDILERLRPLKAGDRCLVGGAAGAVGSCSVQIAKSQKATVVAVAASKDEEWLRGLGAAEVRDGRTDGWWRGGDRFDLVIDTPASSSFVEAAPFLANRGTYVSTNPQKDLAGFARAMFSTKRAAFLLLLRSNSDALGRLLELASNGTLRPAIDSTYDLNEVSAAFHRVSSKGRQGRVMLKVAQG